MKILKAYKYRLKDKSKLNKLYQFTGSCRFVWNKALALQLDKLKNKEKLYSYVDLAWMLVQWKNQDNTAFLKEANAQALQQTLKTLDKAFKDAFNKKQPLKRMPVFKKKGKCTESIKIPVAPKLNGNALFIPKIGWINFFESRKIEGSPKNFTISNKCGKWFVSIQTEIDKDIKKPINIKNPVGLDLGVNTTVTCSTGKTYNHIEKLKELEINKLKIQKDLSRKKLRSNNFYKNKSKLNKIHSKIARVRADFLHKVSFDILKNHDFVSMEKLNTKKMTARKKGSGKTHKAKLNKSILAQGWFELARQLEYKSQWNGIELVKVNPVNTSRQCSSCGHTEKGNRKTQSEFVCKSCKFSLNADLNASINILQAGLSLLGDMGCQKVA